MSREQKPSIIENVMLFPNELVANHLYKHVENLYTDTEKTYDIFIGFIIFLSTAIVIYQSLKLAIGTSKLVYRLFILLPLLLIWIYMYYRNPYKVLNKFPRASIIYNILFLFSIGALFIFKNEEYPTSTSKGIDPTLLLNKLFLSLGLLFFILGIILIIVWSFTNVKLLQSALKNTLLVLIVFSALGIGYILIKKKYFTSKDNPKELSLVEKIVFYIPCLLIDAADYIKEQNKITTPTVWILFFAEIIFISIYYLLPIIFNYLSSRGSTLLLKDPVFLNNRHTLGNFEDFHKKHNYSKKDGKYPFKYEYAISGWFYLNPQPPNTSTAYSKYTPLFNYANKPIIEYNGSENKIRVRTDVGKNKLKTAYLSKEVDYQKWTNFVINYDGADIDVFIDGNLLGTLSNVSPVMKYDSVEAGVFNGIHGGICNIKYHNKNLSKSKIKNSYNLLKLYNPPVI